MNRGYSSFMGYLWLFSVQGHFEVIRCTCDFTENTIKKKKQTNRQTNKQTKNNKKKITLLLQQITAEVYQTSPELSSQWSS